ncbi:MAG TPA: phospholipase D-like domain-containing protein [Acidithiobacillus sp.]|nr:phospholipase D-like domain-containing protein [Acidithiobacillus sp.]
MVQVITDARHTRDLNVYYLSSNPILSALRRDHARGVKVRVILDQHPYGIKPWKVRREARAVRGETAWGTLRVSITGVVGDHTRQSSRPKDWEKSKG